MKTQIRIQDATAAEPAYLLDAIAAAAAHATSGVAVFAFATVAGVDLLFSTDSIRTVATQGQLRLIVGIDAVTDREALLRLQELSDRYDGLTAQVFWNRSDGIFHPKFCYFRSPCEVRCLVGSGNLTPRGLRDSFEAWAEVTGPLNEMRSVARRIDMFLSEHAEDITAIDDAAIRRAAQNRSSDPVTKIEPTRLMPTLVSGQHARRAAPPEPPRRRGATVLIAELPRGGPRWNQANFDFSTARGFFRVDPERIHDQRDIFLTEVQATRFAEREEVRRFTFTKSRNLRVQLAAKSGLAYPVSGRPIVVMRELKTRHFVYHLLFPGENGYRKCSGLLAKHASGSIKRAVVQLSTFRSAWHQSPLSQLD